MTQGSCLHDVTCLFMRVNIQRIVTSHNTEGDGQVRVWRLPGRAPLSWTWAELHFEVRVRLMPFHHCTAYFIGYSSATGKECQAAHGGFLLLQHSPTDTTLPH
ncbi:hypothetical protein GDO78_007377 [Eleutherodactylus coqui]|uniref:Uncharacterized protein n=1 Tax=Eleutherodactylus coqui TaxID=57060 RepID=A0A8J6FIS4_ELECQ|nr:hypothetical protein GDO78_007377 [Eleutherodactylus coqui]